MSVALTDDASALQPCRNWYGANCRWGHLHLAIDGTADDALEHALRLGTVEPELQFLEQWLGVELDVQLGIPPAVPGWQCHLHRALPASTDRDEPITPGLWLWLDAAVGLALPPLPTGDSGGVQIDWIGEMATVLLARIALDDAQIETLAAGAVMLVPESFERRWECELSLFGSAVTRQCTLDTTSERLLVHGSVTPTTAEPGTEQPLREGTRADDTSTAHGDDRSELELVCDREICLGLDALLADDAGDDRQTGEGVARHSAPAWGIALPEAFGKLSCHCRLQGRHLVSGYVAPLAQGHALYVTSTAESSAV